MPEAVLNKDGRPTDEEWEIIRRHPAAATPRLQALTPWLGEWAGAATDHHERYDGKGYPRGLAGQQISRAGRIVAVADAYDVMTAPRSYKPSLPAEQARVERATNSGTQFDPDVVRAFLAVSLGRRKPLAGATNVGGMLDDVPSLVPGPFGPDAPTEAAAVDALGGSLYEGSDQLRAAATRTDGTSDDPGAGGGGGGRSGDRDGRVTDVTGRTRLRAVRVGVLLRPRPHRSHPRPPNRPSTYRRVRPRRQQRRLRDHLHPRRRPSPDRLGRPVGRHDPGLGRLGQLRRRDRMVDVAGVVAVGRLAGLARLGRAERWMGRLVHLRRAARERRSPGSLNPCGQPTRAAWPPSTASETPVMNRASSDARNSAAFATSNASP